MRSPNIHHLINQKAAVLFELNRLANTVLTESDATDAHVSTPFLFGIGPKLKIWWDKRELRSLEFIYALRKKKPDYILFKAHYDRELPSGFKLISRNSVLRDKLQKINDETETGIPKIDENYSLSGNVSILTRLLLDPSISDSAWVWNIDNLSSPNTNDILGVIGTRGDVQPQKIEGLFNFVLQIAMKALV